MIGIGTEVDAKEIVGGFATVLLRLVAETIDRDGRASATETGAKFAMEVEIVGAVEIVAARDATKSLAADFAVSADNPAVAAVRRIEQWVDTDIVARDLARPTRKTVSVLANFPRATLAGETAPTATLSTWRTLRSLTRCYVVVGSN